MDPWLDGLWEAIKEALSKMTSDSTGYLNVDAGASPKETADSSPSDIQLNLLSITDCQNCELSEQSRKTLSTSSASATQTAACDLGPAFSAGSLGLASQACGAVSACTLKPETEAKDAEVAHVTLAASLTHSLPPLSELALNVPLLPPPYLDVSLQEAETTEQVSIRVIKITIIATFHPSSYRRFLLDCWTV